MRPLPRHTGLFFFFFYATNTNWGGKNVWPKHFIVQQYSQNAPANQVPKAKNLKFLPSTRSSHTFPFYGVDCPLKPNPVYLDHETI